MVYIYAYTLEYYSSKEMNEIGSFVEMWMDLESVIHSKVFFFNISKNNTQLWILLVIEARSDAVKSNLA